jgi:hypothetical protein
LHNFWRNTGLVILIFGEGILTLVGGFTGVPTIINLIQSMFTPSGLAAIPNFLQGLQLTLLVIGLVALFAGLM